MLISRFVETLKNRWRRVALVSGATVAAGVLLVLFSPREYRASTAVIVEPQRVDLATGTALPAAMFSHMPTEQDIARSERVALAVVRALSLQNSKELYARWERKSRGADNMLAWLAQEISLPLDVRVSRESNIMSISYSAQSPDEAARMANAFMRAYMDTTLAAQQDPARQSREQLDETTRRLRTNLVQALARLSDFQKRNGIVSSDERLDVETARLAELNTQMVTLQSEAVRAGGRQRRANALPDLQRDPLVAELTTELAREEGRLSELQTRLGEAHPSVAQSRNMIADVRSRIQAATRRASGGVIAESGLAADLLAQARVAFESQRARVLDLNSLRDQSRLLQREAESGQRAYDAALARGNRVVLESSSGRNVFVLKEAAPPMAAVWPKPTLTVIAAAVIGLLCGVAAALWRERGDSRLRTRADVEHWLQRPVLIVLPAAARNAR